MLEASTRASRLSYSPVPVHSDPFRDIATPVVREAAVRVANGTDAAKSGAGYHTLRAVACALDSGSTDPLEQLSEADLDLTLCGRYLDDLRHQALLQIANVQHEYDTADVVSLMLGFERVRQWIAGRQAAEPQLSAASMNMVVEIAHDLRSPLTSILFLSQTLRLGQSGEINELQHRQLVLIYAAALGMVALASNLIELAQGEDQLLEQNPAPFSVAEVLESVCDIVRPIAEEKKLSLRVLPPAVDHRIGFASALSRVLLNLVTNALQNTEEGFVEIAVRPKSTSVLEFSVRDTGPGLPEEAQQAMFEPFRRVRKGSRFGFSGSGLGLAICRRLLAAMGSELQYETAPGWGTRFYLDLELPPATL